MTDPAPVPAPPKRRFTGMTCRLKNRRVYVGRAKDGSQDMLLTFKRLRTKTDPPGPRTLETSVGLSAEAMEALAYTYLRLRQHEDAEHAKKMPTTYTADVTVVNEPTVWRGVE